MTAGDEAGNERVEREAAFEEAEVRALAEKLRVWGDALPAREQELLAGLILASSGGDVAGYAWGASWLATYQQMEAVLSNVAKTRNEQAAALAKNVRG